LLEDSPLKQSADYSSNIPQGIALIFS